MSTPLTRLSGGFLYSQAKTKKKNQSQKKEVAYRNASIGSGGGIGAKKVLDGADHGECAVDSDSNHLRKAIREKSLAHND